MNVVRLSDLELVEGWLESDGSQRAQFTFPFFSGNGAQDLAVVYFEVQPGHALGAHTDSAEEALFILQGVAEATIGDDSGRLAAGEMAIVPSMMPHGLKNVGPDTLKVIGFFNRGTVDSTFEHNVMPFGIRHFSTADLVPA